MRWGRQGQTAGGPIRRFPEAEFSQQGQYSAVLKLEKTKRDSPRFACLRRGGLGMSMSFLCPRMSSDARGHATAKSVIIVGSGATKGPQHGHLRCKFLRNA